MNVLGHNDERALLRRKFIRLQILEAPGPVLIAVALYGKYNVGNVVHPVLNDAAVTTAMLIIGFAIVAWGLPQIIRVLMRISALERHHESERQ
jgi:hypothetical protein